MALRSTHWLLTVFIVAIAACQHSSIQLPQTLGEIPAPRTIEYDWMSVAEWHRQHQTHADLAAEGHARVVFLGDSITAGWHWPLWEQQIAPLGAVNFGIGGDHTGNLLWRLQNGATGNLDPQVVIIMIGVNNFGHLNETPEQVFKGVRAVVSQAHQSFPRARILLNGVLPFEQSPDSPRRVQVRRLNQQLSGLADEHRIFFRDYGQLFLAADGSISTEVMGDFLHLTAQAYHGWAQAMLPEIRLWLDSQITTSD